MSTQIVSDIQDKKTEVSEPIDVQEKLDQLDEKLKESESGFTERNLRKGNFSELLAHVKSKETFKKYLKEIAKGKHLDETLLGTLVLEQHLFSTHTSRIGDVELLLKELKTQDNTLAHNFKYFVLDCFEFIRKPDAKLKIESKAEDGFKSDSDDDDDKTKESLKTKSNIIETIKKKESEVKTKEEAWRELVESTNYKKLVDDKLTCNTAKLLMHHLAIEFDMPVDMLDLIELAEAGIGRAFTLIGIKYKKDDLESALKWIKRGMLTGDHLAYLSFTELSLAFFDKVEDKYNNYTIAETQECKDLFICFTDILELQLNLHFDFAKGITKFFFEEIGYISKDYRKKCFDMAILILKTHKLGKEIVTLAHDCLLHLINLDSNEDSERTLHFLLGKYSGEMNTLFEICEKIYAKNTLKVFVEEYPDLAIKYS
jgi:hypothetical protein